MSDPIKHSYIDPLARTVALALAIGALAGAVSVVINLITVGPLGLPISIVLTVFLAGNCIGFAAMSRVEVAASATALSKQQLGNSWSFEWDQITRVLMIDSRLVVVPTASTTETRRFTDAPLRSYDLPLRARSLQVSPTLLEVITIRSRRSVEALPPR